MCLKIKLKAIRCELWAISDTKACGYPNGVKTCSICLMIVSVAVDFKDMGIGYLEL